MEQNGEKAELKKPLVVDKQDVNNGHDDVTDNDADGTDAGSQGTT